METECKIILSDVHFQYLPDGKPFIYHSCVLVHANMFCICRSFLVHIVIDYLQDGESYRYLHGNTLLIA